MPDERALQSLKDYLSKVPGISGTIGSGFFDDGRWWVKFAVDIDHPLAWSVVQELGHVLNYMSLPDRLRQIGRLACRCALLQTLNKATLRL